jgi:hypothetical protein
MNMNKQKFDVILYRPCCFKVAGIEAESRETAIIAAENLIATEGLFAATQWIEVDEDSETTEVVVFHEGGNDEILTTIQQHILDCMYDYDEKPFPSLELACQHLHNEFERVANYPYNMKLFPNRVNRFTDYLQGIPFHFHFTNYDLATFLGLEEEEDGDVLWSRYGGSIFKEVLANI